MREGRAGGRGGIKEDGGGKNEEEEQEEKKEKEKDEEEEVEEEKKGPKEKGMFPVGPHSPDMSIWETRAKASAEEGPSMKDSGMCWPGIECDPVHERGSCSSSIQK